MLVNDIKQSSMDAFSNILDKSKDPQYYVDRYNNESAYKEWFDKNYPEYTSIYEAVGLTPQIDDILETEELILAKCGSGTELIDGVCVVKISKAKPWWQFW